MVIAQQECLQANRQKLIMCREPEANGGLQPNVNMRNWCIKIGGPKQVQTARSAVNQTGSAKDQGEKWIKMEAKGRNIWNWPQRRPKGSDKKVAVQYKFNPKAEGSNECNRQCNKFKLVAQNTMGRNELKLTVQILRASTSKKHGNQNMKWVSNGSKIVAQILGQQHIESGANTASSDEWNWLFKGWWQLWINLVAQGCELCGQEWILNFEPGGISTGMAEKKR